MWEGIVASSEAFVGYENNTGEVNLACVRICGLGNQVGRTYVYGWGQKKDLRNVHNSVCNYT